MDDENTNTMWDGKSVQPPLRRPSSKKLNIHSNNTNTQEVRSTNELSNLDILSKSDLSVFAKEWYPPNYTKNNMTQRSSHSAQDRIQKMKHNFNSHNSNPSEYNALANESGEHNHEGNALHELEEIMENLIVNPAEFHNIVDTFTAIMKPYYEDLPFVDCVTDLIVEKVISEPNFRYSAVRLCVVIQSECHQFRSALCCLCQKKTKQSNDFNLTLLLAELYAQLNYDIIYAGLLINSLEGILGSGDGNNVKAACQVLKLTGFALENTHKDALNDIFKQLLSTRESQLLTMKNLIDSVVLLRQNNWGRVSNNINVTNNSNFDDGTAHDGPIFYGPDGQELTEEEHQFLNDNCPSQLESCSEENDDIWDPEMTDEMRHAYEEFIKYN